MSQLFINLTVCVVGLFLCAARKDIITHIHNSGKYYWRLSSVETLA